MKKLIYILVLGLSVQISTAQEADFLISVSSSEGPVYGAKGLLNEQGESFLIGNVFFKDSIIIKGPSETRVEYASNGSGSYIIKSDYLGSIQWVKWLDKSIVVSESTLDANGNVLLVGTCADSTDFDPGPNEFKIVGNAESFLLKLNANGDFLKAVAPKKINNSRVQPHFVRLSPNGNIIVSGVASGGADFDPSSRIRQAIGESGDRGHFIASYKSNFELNWIKLISSSAREVRTLNTDDNNRIFVHGRATQTFDANPQSAEFMVGNNPSFDFFTWYDEKGELVSGGSYLTYGFNASIWRVHVFKDGNTLVRGTCSGTVDIAPRKDENVQITTGATDFFVVLDKDLKQLWYDTSTVVPVLFHNPLTKGYSGMFRSINGFNADIKNNSVPFGSNNDAYLPAVVNYNSSLDYSGSVKYKGGSNFYDIKRVEASMSSILVSGNSSQSLDFGVNAKKDLYSGKSDAIYFSLPNQRVLAINEDVPANTSFQIYPNPVTNQIHLEPEEIIEHIFLKDIQGKIVLEFEFEKDGYDVSSLNTGVYFLELHSTTSVSTQKFVKQ